MSLPPFFVAADACDINLEELAHPSVVLEAPHINRRASDEVTSKEQARNAPQETQGYSYRDQLKTFPRLHD